MEVDDFENPCTYCIVSPVCTQECEKSIEYEVLLTYVKYFGHLPSEVEMVENGLTMIMGGSNGRTKRRKDRKAFR